MRILNFAKRNFKEIARDPLSLIFAIILPLFLLFIFQQINIPSESYNIENFTPGIVIFGFSFITLFTATLVAKDRSTSLLIRLGISPMKSIDYILGYMLSILPMILIQNILFFALALILKLPFTPYILLAILISVFISIIFICWKMKSKNKGKIIAKIKLKGSLMISLKFLLAKFKILIKLFTSLYNLYKSIFKLLGIGFLH